MKKKPAQLPEVSDLATAFLQCRDFGHAWEWSTDFSVKRHLDADDRRTLRHVHRIITCRRCTTLRIDEYSLPDFDRVRSTYEYPDGYNLEGGRVHVSEVRAEILKRVRRHLWAVA